MSAGEWYVVGMIVYQVSCSAGIIAWSEWTRWRMGRA